MVLLMMRRQCFRDYNCYRAMFSQVNSQIFPTLSIVNFLLFCSQEAKCYFSFLGKGIRLVSCDLIRPYNRITPDGPYEKQRGLLLSANGMGYSLPNMCGFVSFLVR